MRYLFTTAADHVYNCIKHAHGMIALFCRSIAEDAAFVILEEFLSIFKILSVEWICAHLCYNQRKCFFWNVSSSLR